MANEIPDLDPDTAAHGRSDAPTVARWMNTSRYVAFISLFSERHKDERAAEQPPRRPLKRRLPKADRDALLNAGLILLVIAVAAFVAGLL